MKLNDIKRFSAYVKTIYHSKYITLCFYWLGYDIQDGLPQAPVWAIKSNTTFALFKSDKFKKIFSYFS